MPPCTTDTVDILCGGGLYQCWLTDLRELTLGEVYRTCDTDDNDDDTEEEYNDGIDNEDNEYKIEEEDDEDGLDFEIINTSDSEELEEDKTNY